MRLKQPHFDVLGVVFQRLGSAGTVTPRELSIAFTGSSAELTRVLAELSHAGLIDARRLRLTLPGLAVAVATRAPGVKLTSLRLAKGGLAEPHGRPSQLG